MSSERKQLTGQEKLAILRDHLVERVPISEVCQKHQVQSTQFYQRQKKLFAKERWCSSSRRERKTTPCLCRGSDGWKVEATFCSCGRGDGDGALLDPFAGGVVRIKTY